MTNTDFSLGDVAIFSSIHKADREKLANLMQPHMFRKGDLITKEGQRDRRLFIIVNGEVSVVKRLGEKDQRVLRVFGPCDYFGEMALIDDLPRSASIVAKENTEVLSIDHWPILQEIERYPSMAVDMLQMLSKRIRSIQSEPETNAGTLRPECSCCGNVRQDDGSWAQIELYIGDNSEMRFPHSLCPECRKEPGHEHVRTADPSQRFAVMGRHEPRSLAPGFELENLDRTPTEHTASKEKIMAELKEAEAYVHSLLPERFSSGPVLTDYQFISSSGLGGDMFGYHWLDGTDRGRLALYILDVSGHGVGASLLSVSVWHTLRWQMLPGVDFGDPAKVMEALNLAFPIDQNQGKLISAWYGVYDPRRGSLKFASAGHPPPVVRLGLSGPLTLLDHVDVILGVDPEAIYGTREINMPPMSRLWLYSDGTFEVRSDEGSVLGLKGLTEFVTQADAADNAVEYLVGKIRQFNRKDRFEDDLALVAFTFK